MIGVVSVLAFFLLSPEIILSPLLNTIVGSKTGFGGSIPKSDRF